MPLRLPKSKVFDFLRRRQKDAVPITRQFGRTGESRSSVPSMTKFERTRDGRTICLAHRLDDITVRDYDRVRLYPVVRDGLAALRLPASRANFHFACANQRIADLAMQELGPKMRGLIVSLVRGSMEFGNQVCEFVWIPKFDVNVTGNQSSSGTNVETAYPFCWTIDRFLSFDPQDTQLLIYAKSGKFAGIRQYISAQVESKDVHAKKCVHFVNDREFDSNYGIPRTKATVPFVELAESVYDDMARYSRRFAVPWTVGNHKPGSSSEGGESVANSALMVEYLEALESGSSISIPSEFDHSSQAGGQPLWGINITTAPGEDKYIEKLDHINGMVRLGLVVPEMASSDSPDTGTYNLGEVQIELFLANIESTLDELAEAIDEQLLKRFAKYNFGPDAPNLHIVFEPLDVKVKRALLQALLSMLGSGLPIEAGDGKQLNPDWAKLAEDHGVPIIASDSKSGASALRDQIMKKLQEIKGAPKVPDIETDGDGDQIADLTEGK